MARNINQMVADKLNRMELSETATDYIASTDINVMAELFGMCDTAEEVEQVVQEYRKENG